MDGDELERLVVSILESEVSGTPFSDEEHDPTKGASSSSALSSDIDEEDASDVSLCSQLSSDFEVQSDGEDEEEEEEEDDDDDEVAEVEVADGNDEDLDTLVNVAASVPTVAAPEIERQGQGLVGYLQHALSYVGGGEEIKQSLKAVEKEVRKRVGWMLTEVHRGYSRRARAVGKVVRRTIRRQLEDRLEDILEGHIRPWLEDKVYGDEYMPRLVQGVLQKGVEHFWLDLKEEFWTIYHTKYSASEEEPESADATVSWRFPVLKARAFFLYHLHPCDKTIWGRFRDPVFLLLKGLQIFPLYSVSLISFMLVLAAIDRSDEYQLLQFILQFKGTQFLTVGLFGAIAGATRYYVCVNLFTASQAGQQHSCDTIGPGLSSNYDFVTFVLQIVVVWSAFTLLPYSLKKGMPCLASAEKSPSPSPRSRSAEDADHSPSSLTPNTPQQSRLSVRRRTLARGLQIVQTSRSLHQPTLDKYGRKLFAFRGGYLGLLLEYDLGVFLLVLFLGAVSWSYRLVLAPTHSFWEELGNWRFRADLYWLKTIYGLFSLPFFFFNIPVLGTLLHHGRPTGYTRSGVCVPMRTALPRQRAPSTTAAATELGRSRSRPSSPPPPLATATPPVTPVCSPILSHIDHDETNDADSEASSEREDDIHD